MQSLHTKQDFWYATKDLLPLCSVAAGKELFGFGGLINLSLDDPVYRKIDCILVTGNFLNNFLFFGVDGKVPASITIDPGRIFCYLFQDISDGNNLESFGVGAVEHFVGSFRNKHIMITIGPLGII